MVVQDFHGRNQLNLIVLLHSVDPQIKHCCASARADHLHCRLPHGSPLAEPIKSGVMYRRTGTDMVLVLALVLLSSFRVRTSSGGTKVSLCYQQRALLYTQNAEKFDSYPTNQHSQDCR